jgi:hypothetical protein
MIHVGKSDAKIRSMPIVGWREWMELPDLDISQIKAKIDTGATTSSLHAYDIKQYLRAGKKWVKFKVHPYQRDISLAVTCRAPVVDMRHVKSSTGVSTLRPVIMTSFRLGVHEWHAELTLVDRSEMGFRMLLGRNAMKGLFLVHPGRSFVIGHKPKGAPE